MNDKEIAILRLEVSELRKELDCLYQFIGNFVDLTGNNIDNTKKDLITKFNPLIREKENDHND